MRQRIEYDGVSIVECRPASGIEENGMAEGERALEDVAVATPGSNAQPQARSARREATRERVLDAAREVFAERGVIGGTVEDICERAGFTRGAFYSNFADKDDLLGALIAREHARLVAHLDAGFALLQGFLGGEEGDDAEPGATMAEVVDRLLRAVPDDRHFLLIQTELEIHAIRVPDTSRAFMEADARFRARIEDFLERGLSVLGRELAVDVGDVTEAVIAIVDRSTRRALLAGDDADPDALARVMLPLVIAAASRARP
jgi:AcrR family transcriptional regulator